MMVDIARESPRISPALVAAEANSLTLLAQDKAAVCQAALDLNRAGLPLWSDALSSMRPSIKHLATTLRSLNDAQYSAIWRLALMARGEDGPPTQAARPQGPFLGLMAHLAVMAELLGQPMAHMVPRMTWAQDAPLAERFVRLLIAAAGHDEVNNQAPMSRLVPLADEALKKRHGQGGCSQLRKLAQRLRAELGQTPHAGWPHTTAGMPRPVAQLRSPVVYERTLSAAYSPRTQMARLALNPAVPEYEVVEACAPSSRISSAPHSPRSSRRSLGSAPSDDGQAWNHVGTDNPRPRLSGSRRPSSLSLASSWAGVSDHDSVFSEGHDSWHDLGRSDAP